MVDGSVCLIAFYILITWSFLFFSSLYIFFLLFILYSYREGAARSHAQDKKSTYSKLAQLQKEGRAFLVQKYDKDKGGFIISFCFSSSKWLLSINLY